MSEAIRGLLEAYVPETIDRRGYLYDDPTFGFSSGVNPFTSASDRTDGKFRPYYDNEIDLAYIRGAARNLGLLTPVSTPSGRGSNSRHRGTISNSLTPASG
jgi:hypothetical protein